MGRLYKYPLLLQNGDYYSLRRTGEGAKIGFDRFGEENALFFSLEFRYTICASCIIAATLPFFGGLRPFCYISLFSVSSKPTIFSANVLFPLGRAGLASAFSRPLFSRACILCIGYLVVNKIGVCVYDSIALHRCYYMSFYFVSCNIYYFSHPRSRLPFYFRKRCERVATFESIIRFRYYMVISYVYIFRFDFNFGLILICFFLVGEGGGEGRCVEF